MLLDHRVISLIALLFLLSICLEEGAGPIVGRVPCPCSSPSLCQPVNLDPTRPQVLGFRLRNDDSWKGYDWSQLTTCAWSVQSDLMCHAHSKGARVVLNAAISGSDLSWLTNSTRRSLWANDHLQEALDNHMDGTNFDLEVAMVRDSDLSFAYTALVQETAELFKQYIPHAQITVDVAWSPFDIDGRNYDWVGLAKAADALFVMSYDTRSQIWGRCIASANSPPAVAENGIKQFMSLGIPANKLILGLPWYGYQYPCVGSNLPKDLDICEIKPVAFRGCPCSDAAGKEINYTGILDIFNSSAVSPLRRDPILQSPYFNFEDSTGQLFQMWYDDPASLGVKYEIAKNESLLGVGFWNLDTLNYTDTQQVTSMWDAVKIFTGVE